MKSVLDKVKALLSLPWENEYLITKISEEEGSWVSVSIPLLGKDLCVGVGKTIQEAEKNMRVVLEDIIEEHLRKGRELPLPQSEKDFSGTIFIRTSSSLHFRLSRKAKSEGVSLNYLVGTLLERGLSQGAIESVAEEMKKQLINVNLYRINSSEMVYHCHHIPSIQEIGSLPNFLDTPLVHRGRSINRKEGYEGTA